MRRFLKRLVIGLRVRGRALALVLALIFACILAVPGDGLLPGLRLALFDGYQRAMPRERLSGPVEIVAIDEASLKRYGQWPWPRTRLAELIDRMNAQRPLAIGLDIFMPEADTSSPEALAARLPDGEAALKASLLKLPGYDDVLAASIQRAPVVLGAAGFDVPTPGATAALRTWPVVTRGGEPQRHLRNFPLALGSLPALQAAASGQGLLSADLEHGVVRRVPLVARIGGAVLPSLSVEMLRVATRAPAVRLELGPEGARSVNLGDLHVPSQPSGTVWVHFSRPAPERYISASELLDGSAPPDFLNNKLVIVALTGLGLMDYKTNARGDFMPGVDVHAQLIESFFDGRFLLRPDHMRWAESGALLACSLLLVWMLPRLRLRFAALAWAALSLLLFGGGALLFARAGLLFDALAVWLAMSLTSVSLLASLFVSEKAAHRRSDAALQLAREGAAKAAGELGAARRIQMASLPQAASVFPAETRFAVAALLEPAREVGGDLYDFFMLDKEHLLFLIGDVSGKGLPASLFMVVAKALSKSIALRETAAVPDPGAILNRANRELLRENPEMLFVTAIAGILHAGSGELVLCNAGHDAPRVLRAGGALERLQAADGPPLCVIDNFEYPVQRYRLAPGDTLCLVTDGIPEAMDEGGKQYGMERMDALLAGAGGMPPQGLVDAMREDVRSHVGSVEPWDDITVLVVRWHGHHPETLAV
ncbi:CHASE2 domain-containing protein [Pseudoduganella aquatica]|uniref:CHASE2 domain-containing protein n=1 Tax=Pseudoduganella aquatica TaxID=2660641 RepID=UPI001E2C6B4E|nr:CHASE2 domain-containing protein [Pseudoduganella aquatica]